MNYDFEDSISEFEEALRKAHEGFFQLRLYVSGSSPRSSKAVANITTICEEHLAGRYTLEVVDLYQQPSLACEANVLAAPTLVKEQPQPVRRLVGDMSDEDRVLISLNISRKDA